MKSVSIEKASKFEFENCKFKTSHFFCTILVRLLLFFCGYNFLRNLNADILIGLFVLCHVKCTFPYFGHLFWLITQNNCIIWTYIVNHEHWSMGLWPNLIKRGKTHEKNTKKYIAISLILNVTLNPKVQNEFLNLNQIFQTLFGRDYTV